jgi:hypothetical protein
MGKLGMGVQPNKTTAKKREKHEKDIMKLQ